jgi:hypothetical protein
MRTLRRILMMAALGAMLAPTGLIAQDVMIGVKGGLNFSDLNIDDDSEEIETESKSGLVLGVFADIGLGDMFSVRPEGLYSEKGFELAGGDAELSLNYIEVPVLLVAKFGDSDIRPLVFAGPVIGFESKCEISGSEGGVTVEADCDADPDDPIETESTDFGAAIGGGIEYDAGSFTLLLDGRYTLGLRDVDAGSSSSKNRAWSFMAGAGIDIG